MTGRLNRRELLAVVGGCAVAQAAEPRKPNIVLILLDDLGYGDLGCYGQQAIETPNIDALARDGMRFTDFYAGGAVCAPSRASLMTGLHTGHAPVRANAGTIPLLPEDITLAEVLKGAGYATGGFGKWGLGDARTAGAPHRQGFDRFFGYLHQMHAHSYYPEFLWDNDRKVELPGNRNGATGEYSADLIAQRSLDFIRHNASRPFFLYFACTLPHGRFEVPGVAPYEKKTWTEGEKTYAAMVTRADAQVGNILRLLRELGLERDTLVMLTSDNGAHGGGDKGFERFRSNGDLRGEKGQLYEGGIRVPMIWRWPGRIRAGTTSRLAAAFWDLLPTISELSGASLPGGVKLDGISLAPEFLGGKTKAREFLYWEHQVYNFKQQRLVPEQMWLAVRAGRWKAVKRPGTSALELYDLESDQPESKDVAAGNAGVVRAMLERMRASHSEPRPHDTGTQRWVS
jgi:arylsulfatase A-like enzyme